MEHQEGADSTSMDQGVTKPQTEQVDDDVLVEEEAMGPGLDVQDEVLSYDGEWMDSWRSEKSNNISREKKKAKRRRNRRNRKLQPPGSMKHKNPETISVMLVDITVNGERAPILHKLRMRRPSSQDTGLESHS